MQRQVTDMSSAQKRPASTDSSRCAMDCNNTTDVDYECNASVFCSSVGNGKFIFTGLKPYPSAGENEPPEVEVSDLVADGRCPHAWPYQKSLEDTDPNDFCKKPNNFAIAVVCGISTNESATKEAEADAALGRAVRGLDKARAEGKPADIAAAQHEHDEALHATRVSNQSTPLDPERIECIFDPDSKTLEVVATYINRTGKPVSAEVCLTLQRGTTPVESYFKIDTYAAKREFMPKEQAERKFEELSASKTEGASIQAVDKFCMKQVGKVPAWSARSAGAPSPGCKTETRAPTCFHACFCVSFLDVEETLLRLPLVAGQLATEVMDFAVQAPPQIPGKIIPFTMTIKETLTTETRVLATRASAKLDAERRGMPTFWLPASSSGGGCTVRVATGYSLLFRWRLSNEAPDLTGLPDLASALRISDPTLTQTRARVLSYVPTSDTHCVAECVLEAPKRPSAPPEGAEPKVHHIVLVLDTSYSMHNKQCGNTRMNIQLAIAEVKEMCKRVLALPENFVDGNILGANDLVLFTLLTFHTKARVVCARVALGTDTSAAELDRAAESLNPQDGGGTLYTSWTELLASHLRQDDIVTLCLLTDGQLWDRETFMPSFKRLQKTPKKWKSVAVAYGAWANYETAKIVGIDGEAVVDNVDPLVTSTALKLICQCVASHALELEVEINAQVLTQWGNDKPPTLFQRFSTTGIVTKYVMGIGDTVHVTLVCALVDGLVVPPVMKAKVGSGQSSDVVLDLVAARCNASAVLCKLDPLYCGKGVQKIKLASNPNLHEKILVQIGVYNQRTTTFVTVLTDFVFDPKDDNALSKCTRATAPLLKDTLKTSSTDAWMPSYHEVAKSVRLHTEYEVDVSYENAAYHMGLDDRPCYRSLGGADEEVPDVASSSPKACAEPAVSVAEVTMIEELGATDDGVPTFDGLLAVLGVKTALTGFLTNPNISHIACAATVGLLETTLENLTARKTKHATAPFSVMDTIQKTVGPSLESFIARIYEATAVLSGLKMRYNMDLATDFNTFWEPLPLRDVDVAITRVDYLLRGAKVLHARLVEVYKKPLWRAAIVVHPVVDLPERPLFIGMPLSISWHSEDVERKGDTLSTDPNVVVLDAVLQLSVKLSNCGGLKSGTFVSDRVVYHGIEPPRNCAKKTYEFSRHENMNCGGLSQPLSPFKNFQGEMDLEVNAIPWLAAHASQ
jgi:hypothetical protein